MGVCLDVVQVGGVLLVVRSDAEDGGRDELGGGRTSRVHEVCGEEGGTGMQVQYLRWVALLCALRLDTDAASVMAVKAALEGTL